MKTLHRRHQTFPHLTVSTLLLCGSLFPKVCGGQNVVAWGNNTYGQLNVSASLTNAIAVAAGHNHTLALRDDGTVVAWGDNRSGQCNVPAAATNVISIAAGYNHSLALRRDGTVIGWGVDGDGQVSGGAGRTGLVAIAAGKSHSLALRADGTVTGWGSTVASQLAIPAAATNIIAIVAGGDCSAALRADGTVFSWGGPAAGRAVPPFSQGTVALAAGLNHRLGLRGDGTVYGWGWATGRQAAITNVVAIAAGSDFSLAVRPDGSVIAWGRPSPTSGAITNVPNTVSNAVAVAGGNAHAVALIGQGSPRLPGPIAYSVEAGVSSVLPLYAPVAGQRPLHFRWFADGQPAGTPDHPLPRILAVLGTDAASYQVVVSNSLGSVTSAVAHVKVLPYRAWGDNGNRQLQTPAEATSFVAVSAGGFHTLGLKDDGTVLAWGKNVDGQAAVPPGTTNVVAVAAGGDHSLALRSDGTIIAWGRNWSGQTDVPAAATNVVAIAAGYAHSLALRGDGAVVAWGDDSDGQSTVSFLATEVVGIAAGHFHSLALKADGTVVSWGAQTTVPPGVTDVTAVVAGANHSAALREDGTVIAWGDNFYQQSSVPPEATNVASIVAGAFRTLALRRDGTVVAWGSPQLGLTTIAPALSNVTAVAAGELHNLALVSTNGPRAYPQITGVVGAAGGKLVIRGTVLAGPSVSFQWYKNGEAVAGATNLNLTLNPLSAADAGSYVLVATSAAGQATSGPVSVTVQQAATVAAAGAWGADDRGQCAIPGGLQNPREISAGAFHSLALTEDGQVVGWGKNANGQTSVPPGATNVVQVAAGGDHSLALRADGTVVAWGRNWDGQADVPSGLTNVVAVSAGWAHNLALRADGSLVAWGNNDLGQASVPILFSKVVAISAGYYHNLALLENGSIVSWGLYETVPASVTNVVAIEAGWGHNLALRGDGTVVAWGDNQYGQSTVPASATNVVAVSAGYYHSTAVRSDGTVLCWGRNYHGVLESPPGLGDVVSISAGEDFTLALRTVGPLRVRLQPVSVVRPAGARAVLAASFEGSRPVTYEWNRDGVPVSAGPLPNLVLPAVRASDSGLYTLKALNRYGAAVTTPVEVAVLPEPIVARRTLDARGYLGYPAEIPATIYGEPPFTMRWSRNGIPLSDDANFSGTTTPVLTLPNLKLSDTAEFQLSVTNAHGVSAGTVTRLIVSPVAGWGDNLFGVLNVPPDIGEVVAIAAGDSHVLGLRTDGSLIGWGDNSEGQITIPPSASNVVAIAAGGPRSMALTADGRVLVWGKESAYFTNVPPSSATNVVGIAVGLNQCLALRADGTAVGWGDFRIPASLAVTNATDLVSLAAGKSTSVGLKASGEVASYGAKLSLPNAVAVAAGGRYAAGLTQSGEAAVAGPVWPGGTNLLVVPPEASNNVVAIAVGEEHAVALRADGRPVAWDINDLSQGDIPDYCTNLVGIAAGADFTLGLLPGTRLFAMGPAFSRPIPLGQGASLTAGAPAGGSVHYQWQFNGADIAGATRQALTLPVVRWAHAGRYSVFITDAFGTRNGAAVDISVLPPTLVLDSSPSGFQVSSNQVQLRLTGGSGTGSLVLYSSTNLLNWIPILTNPPGREVQFAIPKDSPEPADRFYRAAETY